MIGLAQLSWLLWLPRIYFSHYKIFVTWIFTLQAAFRSLVGLGYQTFQSLLLDVCQWQPTVELLNSLLDMLVDGDFNNRQNLVIKVIGNVIRCHYFAIFYYYDKSIFSGFYRMMMWSSFSSVSSKRFPY